MSSPIGRQVDLMRAGSITLWLIVSLSGCGDQAAPDPPPTEGLNIASPDEARVTFSRDVAPILYQHCAVCHRAGWFSTICPVDV